MASDGSRYASRGMMNDLNDSASFESYSVDMQNPWLGLHPFTEDLQRYFYGRDDEAEELYRRVNRKTLTVLFGQSGLGKTSLLRAGLFPRLRKVGFLPFAIRIVHTEEAPPPVEQIKAALVAAANSADAVLSTPATSSGDSLWEFFHQLEFSLKSPDGKALVPVLVFDQFEEVFTLGIASDPLRERSDSLLTELSDLVENRPPKELQSRLEDDPDLVEQLQFDRADYRVLISLREDYLANLEDMRQRMPSLSENRMRLTRMNGEQALDAVSKPGAHLVSPIVSRQIVRFVAGAVPTDEERADVDLSQYEVDPAMLSLFCAELNNRRRAQGLPQITADLLAGSRETILRDYYERCLADAHPEVRRWIEDELLTETGFRVDVPLEKARKMLVQKGASESALDDLVKRRLLRIEERLHVSRIELTHDVLTSVVRHSRDERRQQEQVRQSQEREQRIREQLRRARQRLVATVIIAASTIALITGAFYLYLDRWVWPHVTYYSNFSKQFGTVHGIGELSPKSLSARAVSFKVTKIGRGPNARVESIEAIDSYGKPTGNHSVNSYLNYASEDPSPSLSRECRWEFVYDNDGRVVYEKAFNKLGKLVWCFVYSPSVDRAGTELETARTAHGHFIGEDGYPRPQRKSSAEYVEIQYSPEGWEVLRTYSDRNGRPQPGLDRAYGVAREYDALGRLTKTMSLDAEGNPMMDSAANCAMVFSDFDESGNSRWSISLDTEGKPVPTDNGYTKERREYDQHGNMISSRYFDASDRPVRCTDGYAGYDYQRDARGNPIKFTYVDEKGQPTESNFGQAGWTASFDERGEFERHYFGPDGKPTKSRMGISIVKYERDVNGLITKQMFFDRDSKPTFSTEGVAGWTSKFNDRGQEIERRFFDVQGRPTRINTDKSAGWLAIYDDRGNKITTTYLGLDGKPGPNENGIVTQKSEYDDFGNQKLVQFFDEAGKPCRHKDGYAGYQATFDGRGNAIRFLTLDEQGQLLDYKGVAGWDVEYDSLGRRIALRFLDVARNPTLHADGYAGWLAKYDAAGHEIERRYIDHNGNTASRHKGPAYWKASYNQFGKQVEKAFFDSAGKPAPQDDGTTKAETKFDPAGRKLEDSYHFEVRPHEKGYRREVYKYDEFERNTSIEYFDEQGRPFLVGGRFARKTFERNANGLVTRRRYFDDKGKPALNEEGIGSSTSEYDDRGNEIALRYFDLDGKPMASPSNKVSAILSVYDAHNNEVKREFRDADHKLTLNSERIAGWNSTFDSAHHELERRFFDTDGAPTLVDGRYARWTASYDPYGNIRDKRYFDLNGGVASTTDGTTRIEYEYDRAGHELKRTYFYELRPQDRGYDAETVTYDERGNVVQREYWDQEGRPTVNAQKIHRIRYVHDEKAHATRQYFFGERGESILSGQGVHGWTSLYDDSNNEVKRSFFDLQEKPTAINAGYAGYASRYNSSGKLVERAFFDVDGNPAPLEGGTTRQVYEYDDAGKVTKRTDYYEKKPAENGQHADVLTFDERGNSTSLTFLDAAGKPATFTSQVAIIAFERDANGRLTRRRYFDPDGKPTLNFEGIAAWTSAYDENGNETERRFFGFDDQPILIKGTAYAGWSARYNDKGRKVEQRYFDAAGKPAPSSDGYTGFVHTLRPNGRLEQTVYEYESERNARGYSRAVWKYDDRENVTEITFQDAEEQAVRHSAGYFRVTLLYDVKGKLTQKRYDYERGEQTSGEAAAADADNQPATDADASQYQFSYMVEDYGEHDHVTGSSYHLRDGQLTIGESGFAKSVTKFNDAGNAVISSYFDERERPLKVESRITEVLPNSQGDALKILPGDVLVTYDGKPVTDMSSFIHGRTQEKRDGKKRQLVVRRGSEMLNFEVSPGSIGIVLVDRVPVATKAEE